MDLRVERRVDRDAVRRLHLAGFRDHGQVVADLVEELRGAITVIDGLSLIAEDSADVIGHVMLTRSLLDAPRRIVDVQVLSPVEVRPGCQGQGSVLR